MKNMWRSAGLGPRVSRLRGVLGIHCPFSVKAFGKLDDLLALMGEDRITVKLRLGSQPWHMYSGVIVLCILAASSSTCCASAVSLPKQTVAVSNETDHPMDLAALNCAIAAAIAAWA